MSKAAEFREFLKGPFKNRAQVIAAQIVVARGAIDALAAAESLNDALAARNKVLREALGLARGALTECSLDYNSPRFTDRHQTGPRITKALAAIGEALAQKEPGE